MVTLIPQWARRRPVAVAPAPAPVLGYDPHDDGRPDPGEIVWTWVPYEDDSSQGKDRPVLLIGRHANNLVGLYLTSKDHDRDAAQEARAGRCWLDVGSGAWDRRGRPSEVRLDRLLVINPTDVRREGATMPPGLFEAVLAAARALPERHDRPRRRPGRMIRSVSRR